MLIELGVVEQRHKAVLEVFEGLPVSEVGAAVRAAGPRGSHGLERQAGRRPWRLDSAKVTLSLVGKWRMRARHLDASHALTYSGWRYVTVK